MRAQVYANVFALVFVALIVQNIYWGVRNQSEKECHYTVCVGPENAHGMALRNKHPVVKGRVALAFALRHELAGKTLEIPPWLEESTWRLEKISRIHVEPQSEPALLNTDRLEQLRERATSKHQWFKRKKRRKGWYRDVYVLAISDEERYVVAETGETLGPIFLLPKTEFSKVARAPRKKKANKNEPSEGAGVSP